MLRGGWYKETFRSGESFPGSQLPKRFSGERNFHTAIYYLSEDPEFSAFHRIQSDELWHFYAGATLRIYELDEHGNTREHLLGYPFTGIWLAAKPLEPNTFALVGCTVAPGFDYRDFELAKREALVSEYPQYSDIIKSLTS